MKLRGYLPEKRPLRWLQSVRRTTGLRHRVGPRTIEPPYRLGTMPRLLSSSRAPTYPRGQVDSPSPLNNVDLERGPVTASTVPTGDALTRPVNESTDRCTAAYTDSAGRATPADAAWASSWPCRSRMAVSTADSVMTLTSCRTGALSPSKRAR
jgi:hypothetical protein